VPEHAAGGTTYGETTGFSFIEEHIQDWIVLDTKTMYFQYRTLNTPVTLSIKEQPASLFHTCSEITSTSQNRYSTPRASLRTFKD
jgi:hypothetical protein